ESESVAEGQRTRVLDGLAAYGKRQRAGDGAVFVVDEFLGTYSGAAVAGTLVVGVKGAADEQTARKAIAELQAAAAALSPATLDRALAEASERADSAGAEDPPPGEQEGPAADDDLEEDM
ncbi:MAG: hypothetical protein KJO07_10120, partial [Deltaproteobacteria bacterium]|nr:hypothetical protein [Deltaproteobacteria bacterium]